MLRRLIWLFKRPKRHRILYGSMMWQAMEAGDDLNAVRDKARRDWLIP
mgnify:CR=1 FL=1